MKIIKLVSQPSKKVKGIDGHSICMNSIVYRNENYKTTKPATQKACIVTLKQYSTLLVEKNFLLNLEEEKQH